MQNNVTALSVYDSFKKPNRRLIDTWEGITLVVLASIFIFAFCLNLIIGHPPLESNSNSIHTSPFSKSGGQFYLLGTNAIGQDLFSQVMYAMLFSFGIGILLSFINTFIATMMAIEHAYSTKSAKLISFIGQLLNALPSIFVLILFSILISEVSLLSLILVLIFGLCLTGWVSIYNQLSLDATQIARSNFVMLSKSLGVKGSVLKRRTALMLLPKIITQFLLMVPKIIISETTIGFLGLIPSEFVTLGTMINASMNYAFTNPIEIIVPVSGIIYITVLTHLMGYGLVRRNRPNEKIN